MSVASLYETVKRYQTLKTHRISSLPIAILMPHSACNCKCIMCDIWKDNKNLKQLKEADINGLLESLQKLGTKQVLMSGGEALLNPNFFELCAILKKQKISITVLSTGLTLKKHAENIIKWVDEVIVSLDGDEELHDEIRNIGGAFIKMQEAVTYLKELNPNFPIRARTVIHRLNFHKWPDIIEAAQKMGIDQISFLPADVSSQAFNRDKPWDTDRQSTIVPEKAELGLLSEILEKLIIQKSKLFKNQFIAESPEKLRKIVAHYAAYYQLNPYPYKKCNAPWVSVVIEPDGHVRPCFFHPIQGNIREASLEKILNSKEAIQFRRNLDIEKNETCMKCVCYLNLSPRTSLS